MRFSWLAEQRLSWPELLTQAAAVKRAGYDAIWLSDHVLAEDGSWLLDCLTTAGALGAAVPQVGIGTLVAANTFRHPPLIAQAALSLDRITGGRFVLGIGAGGSREEHEALGIPFPPIVERAERLEEACAAIRGTLRDQGTKIPLLVGGLGRHVLDVVARHADRWTVWADPYAVARLRGRLDEHCRAVGRNIADIRRGAITMITPTHLPVLPGGPWEAVMAGDRAAMREQVARYTEAGVDELVVCEYAVAPGSRAEALQWFAEQVAG
ncbi:LLM class flavin-dependent oxidoreductase [Streptomyces sp. NPDC051677]|uniref:LLM class flavin-dependent oxidoreductase n=1 Tax=Streptomyces sp. NPDC051677 TaxID=3365669 RepID=UPI0037D11AB4